MAEPILQKASPGAKRQRHRKFVKSAKPVTISPDNFDAVLFDMDGVVTRTADIHASTWKHTFDEFLKQRTLQVPGSSGPTASGTAPFGKDLDYHRYVDGKSRCDGAESFLKSRNIDLPTGKHDDPPGFETVWALSNLKNQAFIEHLQEHHVQAYETTIALIQSLKQLAIKVAVITASENGVEVLKAANLLHIFDAKVDGTDAIRLGLDSKPKPDVFLEGAKQLGVLPKRAVVIEDAAAGVEAGKNGKFGLVIGVNRHHNAKLLQQHGADVVVSDLSEVSVPGEAIRLPGMALIDLGISDQNWVVKYDQFDPKLQGRREALCALGNGYFVTRAATPESQANGINFPGTYCAGVYNRLTTTMAGLTLEHEDLVNLPNWLPLTFKIEEDPWFELENMEIVSYSQELALHEGILYRQIRFRDHQGRESSLSERRFVHMQHFHLAGLEITITPHNWSGTLTVRSALDGRVLNAIGVYISTDENRRHLESVDSDVIDDLIYLKMRTTESQIGIAEAARTTLLQNGQLIKGERSGIIKSNYAAQDISLRVAQGDQITIQKVASLFTSRDHTISEEGLAAKDAISDAPDFAKLIEGQIETWRHLWSLFDLALETREDTPKAQPSLLLHLNGFHALATASQNSEDLDIGIPARGWSEGYEGHVFWDDLYMFPYFNLRMPLISQALLKYRYRRLDEARKLATTMGVPGARYPWQSGSTGREETPKGGWDPKKQVWNPDYSHMQVHVNAAIAFNLWNYYQVTGDLEFMHTYGADVLFEIARFFAHIAKYNPQRDRYEIHGIVGPDEYHVRYPESKEPGINNNAYTNLMAVWTLSRALELLELLSEHQCGEVCGRLSITDSELKLWDDVSRKMFVPLLDNGIISEFEGYEQLQEFPRQKDGFIDFEHLKQVLEEEAGLPNRYKVSKQPDVLMLFYLFSSEELKELFDRLHYQFRPESIPKNIDYYVRQTANNSSLSRVAVAWVLSRMNRTKAWKHLHTASSLGVSDQSPETGIFPASWDIFQEALGTDFFDIQGGTTVDGLHMGAMIGTIDIVQRCYTGLVTKDDVLWLNPCLPEELSHLSFCLQYRHQAVQFEINQQTVRVTAGHSSTEPIKVGFKNRTYKLSTGQSKLFNLSSRD